MPRPTSFVDRIHYDGTRKYTKREGNVAYLDGTALKRPFLMPTYQRVILAVIIIAAVVIGAILVHKYVVSHWEDKANAEMAVAANISNRDASINTIPNVASLINQDNEAIKNSFKQAGYTTYDGSSLDDSYDMLLYKLPSDMTVDEAGALYVKGVNTLSAADASKLLNGSWSFAVDRVNGTSMVVRYADFTTSDPQIAVQNALAKEGWDAASATETGTDDSGNTYTLGTLDADGTACTWKISAIPLDEIYSIAGLPTDACFVGIRVTAA